MTQEEKDSVIDKTIVRENGKVCAEHVINDGEHETFDASIDSDGVWLYHSALEAEGLFLYHDDLQKLAELASEYREKWENGDLWDEYEPSQEEIELIKERMESIEEHNEHLSTEEVFENFDVPDSYDELD